MRDLEKVGRGEGGKNLEKVGRRNGKKSVLARQQQHQGRAQSRTS